MKSGTEANGEHGEKVSVSFLEVEPKPLERGRARAGARSLTIGPSGRRLRAAGLQPRTQAEGGRPTTREDTGWGWSTYNTQGRRGAQSPKRARLEKRGGGKRIRIAGGNVEEFFEFHGYGAVIGV
jgi:hypothetical protein